MILINAVTFKRELCSYESLAVSSAGHLQTGEDSEARNAPVTRNYMESQNIVGEPQLKVLRNSLVFVIKLCFTIIFFSDVLKFIR